MEMHKINQKKIGVILAYLSQAIHMVSGLLYTPIMLRLLGQSEYGLYQLVNSVVSYLGLLSFGFTGAYMRFYAKYERDNSTKDIEKLNGMFFIVFTIIAIVCIFCGVILTGNITAVFQNGLTATEYSKAKILMMLMVMGLSTTMFSTVFTCYATAHEQFVFQRLLEVFQNLLNPFITLPLLLLGYGSIGMVVVSTSLVILKFVVNFLFCKNKLQIKFCFKNLNFGVFKELGAFTFFIFLNQLIDKVNWSLDKVLLGRFCGTVEVAIYGVAANLNLMYQNLLSAVSSVFVPKVNRLVMQNNDNKELTDVFIKVGRIQFIMAYLIVSGYIFFGKPFIKLWAGQGYDTSYYVGLLLLIPATMELIQYLGIEIQRAKNMHQTRSVVYTAISIGNIIISIPLICKYGSIGAALGTTIALICGTWIFMNIYYQRKIGLNIVLFWKKILMFIPSLIPSIIVGILINKNAKISGWISLLFFIAIYVCVYSVSILFIGLNEEEKKMFFRKIHK
jgi:O-antigen/teichoic acid export membrane protein